MTGTSRLGGPRGRDEQVAAQDRFKAMAEECEQAAEAFPSLARMLRSFAEGFREAERLREQVNSGRTGRERAEGLPEETLPRV